MNLFTRTVKRLPKKGEHNVLKIISLAIGLSAALVMLSKVFFENSYDNFFTDKERIYKISSSFKNVSEDNWSSHPTTSGAYAYTAQQELQIVEAGTRFAYFANSVLITDDRKTIDANFQLADSSFFAVFDRPIISGDPAKVLATPNQVMITDEMAEQLGGDPIGQVFEINSHPGVKLIVGGVYEAIPENSHLEIDVLVAMPTIEQILGWDGSMGWLGNDRYHSYVKLVEGTSVTDAENEIYEMIGRHIDMDEVAKTGVEFRVVIKPVVGFYSSKNSVQMMVMMLSILAFVILLAAIMNYVLIAISSLTERSREVALHRCYGATNAKIHMMSLVESFVHIVLALMISVFILFSFRTVIEELMGVAVVDLFSISNCWPLLLICLVVWLFSALLPGSLFSKVPVTAVFRAVSDNKRTWKMTLLFLQFFVSAFLVMMLWIVSSQYTIMINDNVGYSYENVIYANISPLASNAERERVKNEIASLPEVSEVSSCTELPFGSLSGNNVYDGSEELFNIADFYDVSVNYFDFMGIPIIEGDGFTPNGSNEVMVSRRFVDKMRTIGQWEDDESVGQMVYLSERENVTVCGVYEDVRVGNAEWSDSRPSVTYYTKDEEPSILLIKLRETSSASMASVNAKLKELAPERIIDLFVFGDKLSMTYEEWLNFRNSVLVGSLIALLITILGLIGYINNEINRRKKEMAIRKINGATKRDIIMIYARQTLIIAVIAFVIGVVCAVLVGNSWQEQFAEKATIGWYLGVVVVVMLSGMIYGIILLKCMRIDSNNPIIYLKD